MSAHESADTQYDGGYAMWWSPFAMNPAIDQLTENMRLSHMEIGLD